MTHVANSLSDGSRCLVVGKGPQRSAECQILKIAEALTRMFGFLQVATIHVEIVVSNVLPDNMFLSLSSELKMPWIHNKILILVSYQYPRFVIQTMLQDDHFENTWKMKPQHLFINC